MRGHIRRRGKSSWEAIVYLGQDPSGRRRYLSRSFRTRREAEEWVARQVVDSGAPTASASRVRFGEFAQRWLDAVAPRLSPKTAEEYTRMLRRYLLPAFGHLPLSRISPAAIEQWVGAQLASGASPTSVRHRYALLRELLASAVRWGVLARNPGESVDPPRRRRFTPRVWDEEQARLFLAEARRSSALYPLYLTAVLTGMRQAELVGLQWEDVDLATGTVVVRRSMYRLGKKVVEKEPKSGRTRTVLLPEACVEALRVLRESQRRVRLALDTCPDGMACRKSACPGWHATGLVFAQPNGKPLHADNVVRRDFRRVVERAGVPRIRFHDLRHVHATLLLRGGVNPRVVQERLGHSTAAFTLQTYAHLLPGWQREAVEAAERMGLAGIGKLDPPEDPYGVAGP